MPISIYDINAIADICIILSSFYIFVKWRKLNQRMAWSFVLLGTVSVFSAAANFYEISGDANFLLRIPLNVFFTVFLAFGISEMIKGAKPLFYSFLLYLLVLPGFALGLGIGEIYAAVGLAGRIIGTAFFAYLMVQKHSEIRVIALLGLMSMLLGGLFTILAVSNPFTAQHFYISKGLIALALLGFAHVSIHAPDSIYKVYRKRPRR